MTMEDGLLEKYGEYYCSQYVAKNQPWILKVPFHEWVDRQVNERSRRMEDLQAELCEWFYESKPETALLPEIA
jgi:hypothetical protein